MSMDINPLSWNVPIVDKLGRPSKEFQIKWAQLNKAARSIPSLNTPAAVSALLDILTAGGVNGSLLVRQGGSWQGYPSPSNAAKFLAGTNPPTWADVDDADLVLSDVLTNNVSTTKHGFAPKLPDDATKYLDGTGSWSVPAGGGGGGGNQSFRYWRIHATASNGGNGLDMFEVIMSAGGVNKIGAGTASASSTFAGLPASNAFDGNTTTRWASDFSNTWPQWLKYDFGSAVAIDTVRIMQASATDRAPRDFTVQGSNDNTNWTTVATFVNITGWSLSVYRNFTVQPVPGSAMTIAASGSNVTIGTGTFINFTGLDPDNYDYKLRMRLTRPLAGAVATDYLKVQFGGVGGSPAWFTDTLFQATQGSSAANLTTSGGITRIAQVQNNTTRSMGVMADIQLDNDGSLYTLSMTSNGFMWENVQRLDGTLASPIGAMRFNTDQQSWTAAYVLWAMSKAP